MGEVVAFPKAAKRSRKRKGDLFECIVPLSVYIYGADGEAAGMSLTEELHKRLEGLQFEVDDMLIRPANIPHLDA